MATTFNTTRATSSPDITDDSLAWLEDNSSFRNAAVQRRLDYLDRLLPHWGEPMFQSFNLPTPVAGFETCCRARISLSHRVPSPLLVRTDYRDLWTGLQEAKNGVGSYKGFIIWGQPGQGKTSALDIYTLICVENRVPFVRYVNGEKNAVVFIDTDQGARMYLVPPDELDSITFSKENFFFVDAGKSDNTFPERTSNNTVTIFATSPTVKRYSFVVKDSQFLLGTIALCSREEAFILPVLNTLPPTPPTHDSSFSRFEELNFSIPSGFPDEGYSDDLVDEDLRTPNISLAQGEFYPPIVRFHVCGPDMRRLQLKIPVEPGQSLSTAHLDKIPFSALLDDAPGVKSLISADGRSLAQSERTGYHRVLFHTPLPANSARKRWCLDAPDQKVIIPNRFLLDGLVHASASRKLDRQREILGAFLGTSALEGLVFEGFVNSLLAKVSEVKLVIPSFSDGTYTNEAVQLRLKPGDSVQEWAPREDQAAPSEAGVYAVVPRSYPTIDGLLVALEQGSAKATRPVEADSTLLFETPIPSPVPSPAPPASLPYIDVVYQATVATTHDVKKKGKDQVLDRLDKRDISTRRRRVFAFVCPDTHNAKVLAKHWSKAGVEGFEVGYLELP